MLVTKIVQMCNAVFINIRWQPLYKTIVYYSHVSFGFGLYQTVDTADMPFLLPKRMNGIDGWANWLRTYTVQ